MFNGHRSKAAYDVYNEMMNCEGWYLAGLREIRRAGGNCQKAARRMIDYLPKETVEGSRYTITSVMETLIAMKGQEQ